MLREETSGIMQNPQLSPDTTGKEQNQSSKNARDIKQ